MTSVNHPLRLWREKAGVSLRTLADRMVDERGQPIISYASLGRIERGLQDPSFRVLLGIFEATDGQVRLDDFVPRSVATRVVDAAKGAEARN